jgi:hypothetical protein
VRLCESELAEQVLGPFGGVGMSTVECPGTWRHSTIPRASLGRLVERLDDDPDVGLLFELERLLEPQDTGAFVDGLEGLRHEVASDGLDRVVDRLDREKLFVVRTGGFRLWDSYPRGLLPVDAELGDLLVMLGDAAFDVPDGGPEDGPDLLTLLAALLRVPMEELGVGLNSFRYQVDFVVEAFEQDPRLVILVAGLGNLTRQVGAKTVNPTRQPGVNTVNLTRQVGANTVNPLRQLGANTVDPIR